MEKNVCFFGAGVYEELISNSVQFKGSLTRYFSNSSFFHKSVSPGPFQIFPKTRRDIRVECLSPVSLIPAINLSPMSTAPATVTTTLVIRCVGSRGVAMNASFHAVRMKLCVFNFGGRRYCRFGLKYIWRLQGPLIRLFGVSMDASFLFMVVPMNLSAAVSDFGGRR